MDNLNIHDISLPGALFSAASFAAFRPEAARYEAAVGAYSEALASAPAVAARDLPSIPRTLLRARLSS